ncbi:unnamed protein product [Camellia sinensis]
MKLISSVSVSLCVFFLVLFCVVFVVKGKGDDANTLLVDSDNSVNVRKEQNVEKRVLNSAKKAVVGQKRVPLRVRIISTLNPSLR